MNDPNPILIIKFLRWFCPDHLIEEIEGDLLQKFKRDLHPSDRLERSDGYWRRRAKQRLLWNVIRYCRPGIVLRNNFSVRLTQLPMFQNYLKTTYRHIAKSKVNFAFKLGGLTVALFSFLVIALYVSYQLSFDQFHEDYQNVYRVNSTRIEDGKQIKYANVPPALGPALKAEFAEVKSFAGVSEWGYALMKFNDKLLRSSGFIEADSSIFDVFSFALIEGNKNALNDPHAIILSESLAKRIFGEEDPLNKLISFPDRFNRVLEVKAIIKDLPPNSSMSINAIMNFEALRDDAEQPRNRWDIGWAGYSLFLKMNHTADIENFPAKVKPLLERNLKNNDRSEGRQFTISLQPLDDIYLGDQLKWEFDNKGNVLYLYICSSLAFFLLLIASINYLNLSIADFNFRNKEIGVRKILGARKKQIAIQITLETTLYCLAALGLSVGMLYFLFPDILQLLDPNLQFAMLLDSKVVVLTSLTLVSLIIFSTAYPAYHLATNNPIDDLKRIQGLGGKISINKLLLLAQFSISVFCICATWIVGDQLKYIKTKDIGFNRHNVFMLFMPDRYPLEKAPVLKNEITKIPGVESASYSYYRMTAVPYFNDWYKVEIRGEMKRKLVNELFVDQDFFQTMNVAFVSGRNFDIRNKNEFRSGYIVNEAAVREFGWADPIGKKITRIVSGHEYGYDTLWDATVIGVVRDFNTRSLHEKIEPLVMRLQYDSWPGYCLNVKVNGDFKRTFEAAKKAYSKVLPEYLVDFDILEDMYQRQYQNEDKAYVTLQAATWVILLISFLGIFSLSIYMSIKRMREFGIRKVLGANVRQIAVLHINHFLKIAVLANIIALPIAYWLMKTWLDGFAYRTALSGFVFLLVSGILFLLVIASAGYSAWKAGHMNPVDVIKME
jgi:putative ABC transport system permease protein